MTVQAALTDQRYWDEVWRFTDEQRGAAPALRCDRNQHEAGLDRLFRASLGPGARFLEIGSGGSAWPAHVAARYGAEAWGIDFSRGGLQMASAAAARDGVKVHMVEGDFFDRSLLPAGQFEVVYSGGFVEHFPDAAPLMERVAGLLSPGGVVITAVPNLDGINGILQRVVDESCYRRHVVFTPASLDAAHALGGLRAIAPAQFWGVVDFGAVNFSRLASRLPAPALKLLWAGLTQSRRCGEALARRLGASDGGRRFAAMIVGVYSR